ncbi:hypothetical protein KP509_21G024800 [Ceratopteris richardii]|uniref:Uncharacterized protein n=1 Tax=Ceratopteris richardii TaxID=49495 RepID=A0A8T2SB90_CERRI|nr:hypothetical protein KP509_21G024800 [Ceratopteris richardii]
MNEVGESRVATSTTRTDLQERLCVSSRVHSPGRCWETTHLWKTTAYHGNFTAHPVLKAHTISWCRVPNGATALAYATCFSYRLQRCKPQAPLQVSTLTSTQTCKQGASQPRLLYLFE